MSTGRVIGIRVALGVFILATLVNAVSVWVSPRDAYGLEAGEVLTSSAETIASSLGVLALAWAMAAALALWKPLNNLGLLQAIIVAAGAIGLHGIYVNVALREDLAASDWNAPVLMLVVCVALVILYPRAQKV